MFSAGLCQGARKAGVGATDETKRQVMSHLGNSRFATVVELSGLLGLSTVSVRRHLEMLERQGLVRRTRGGAFLADALVSDAPFVAKKDRFAAEKQRIAAAAAALVKDGDAVALAAGTTTWEVARCLKDRSNLTVVTNSIAIASEFVNAPGIRLVVTGGTIREGSQALVGPAAVRGLQEICVNQMFLGVDGIHWSRGVTLASPEEAQLDRAMMRTAQTVTVVADRSKFDRIAFSLVATLGEVQRIITDSGLDPETLQRFQGCPAEIVRV